MGNPVAAWLAAQVANATAWELAALAVGLLAVAVTLWGAVDNVFDLRAVRRSGAPDGPRWLVAFWLLVAHVAFLIGWLGYTHVALTASYLPSRPDMEPAALSEVAVMRLLYAVGELAGQVALRMLRVALRSLSREQWQPLFGEAARYQALWHAAQARALRLEGEVLTARSDKHDALNRESGHLLRVGVLERLLRQHGIAYPPRVVVDDAPSAESKE